MQGVSEHTPLEAGMLSQSLGPAGQVESPSPPLPQFLVIVILFCFCYSLQGPPWEKETETEAEFGYCVAGSPTPPSDVIAQALKGLSCHGWRRAESGEAANRCLQRTWRQGPQPW